METETRQRILPVTIALAAVAGIAGILIASRTAVQFFDRPGLADAEENRISAFLADGSTHAGDASSYAEYAFDSGDDSDLGFTHRAYDRLAKARTLLDAGSPAVGDEEMGYAELSYADRNAGVIERRTAGEDTYELARASGPEIDGIYRVSRNGMLLFEEQMNFGAEGPIQDARIVDGKPAFTFIASCRVDENNLSECVHDIWYDGAPVSRTFGVTDPRYLFSHGGKLGFVAANGEADAIFYDGAFVTPGFDLVWTHNCCSFTEILPTVYENGTLLFYAMRGETTYLVERRLE